MFFKDHNLFNILYNIQLLLSICGVKYMKMKMNNKFILKVIKIVSSDTRIMIIEDFLLHEKNISLLETVTKDRA